MLSIELTPNNAGFVLWGDVIALDELHQFIHYVVEESPLITNKEGFVLALAYDIRKAREGSRLRETYQHKTGQSYDLYGVQLLWPLVIFQIQFLRKSLAYIPTDKQQLAIMYLLEYLTEAALAKALSETWQDVIQTAQCTSEVCFEIIEDIVDSRCCYFISLPPKARLNKLGAIIASFDERGFGAPFNKKNAQLLRELQAAESTWPDVINW